MKIHEALSQLADFARCGYGDAQLFIALSNEAGSHTEQPVVIQEFVLSRYTVETDGSIKLWDPSAELLASPNAPICIVAQISGKFGA